MLEKLLREAFRLDGTGRLLDLGCGPGSVAIPLAPLFEQVVAMDPEPDMLEEGSVIARRAGVENIDWLSGSWEDVSRNFGEFRLVTMGESFHWMDRFRTLEALNEIVSGGGGVAIVGRGIPYPLGPIPAWRAAICRVIRRYLGEIRLPWDQEPCSPEERDEAYLRRSRFKGLVEHQELFEVPWTVESVIGNLYSMSFSNRKFLGERAAEFERDLRNAILEVEPSGVLRGEIHQFSAYMAFKQ